MSRLPSSAPRANARIRILGIDQPESVEAPRRRIPVLPVILLGVAVSLGTTLVLSPDDPQPSQPPPPLSQPSSRIVLMATADHAAFVPRPRVAHVMATATHANLDSAARHAARTEAAQEASEPPAQTPAYWPATSPSTSTVDAPVTAVAPQTTTDTTATGTTIGPEAPPNPAAPSQIDAP